VTPTLSIRTSLFALAAVLVLPLVGLGAFSIYADFRAGSAAAEEDAMARARTASRDLEQLVGENEEALAVLARWYARENPDAEECGHHLVEASSLLSRFFTLSVVDREGRLVCASRPVGSDTPASLADRQWLRDVVASGSFVVSKPVQGRFSGEWISVFAHPIRDAEGAVRGAMVGSVDVHTFQGGFDDALLPPGGVITLAHADGTVVARSEDPDRYVGTVLPDGELSEEQLLGGVGFNRTRGIEGTDRIWAWSPISGVEWVVFAGIPTDWIYGPIRRAALQRGLLLLAVFSLVVLLTVILHRDISRSLELLAEDTRAAAEGANHPVREQGPLEVRQVARQFNRTLRARVAAEKELRETEDRMRERQKMEAVGRLAGGVAHDFNNLLTVIRGEASLLADELSPESALGKNARAITRAGERAADLVRQLLAFSRREVTRPRPTDLSETLRSLDAVVRSLVGESVTVETDLAEDLDPVLIDPNQAEQMILNLVVNARDAMPDGGRLHLATASETVSDGEHGTGGASGLPPGDYVAVSIRDTGAGMEPEVRERIFEPFFTTKARDQGTGLGLSTVYGIVTQLGGHVTVQSTPGEGSTFTIHLPTHPTWTRAERTHAPASG